MKDWYQALNRREQRIVLGGGIALLILIGYMAIWEPLKNTNQALTQQLIQQQQDRQWMQQATLVLKQRTAGGVGAAKNRGRESLLTLVDRTAKQHKLGEGIKRVQPDEQGTVRIWLEQVPFDVTMRWLGDIERNFGVVVADANMERQSKPGVINARLVLSEG